MSVLMNQDHWRIHSSTVTVMDAMLPFIKPVMVSSPFHKDHGFVNDVKVKNVLLGW